MEAVAPIFVLDREGWISVFDSVAETENGLETNDVETGEYVALDAVGRPLRLATEPVFRVRLAGSAGDARPELLRRVLLEALGGDDQRLDGLTERARARRGEDLRAAGTVGELRAAVQPSGP